MQVKKQQLELDMEQQTGSKSGKKYVKAVYCHPAYLTYMQSEAKAETPVLWPPHWTSEPPKEEEGWMASEMWSEPSSPTAFWPHLCYILGLPKWLSGKESACNAGDAGLIPGVGKPPEGEMATHSCILAWEIPQTEKPGRAAVHGVAKSWTRLSTHAHGTYCIRWTYWISVWARNFRKHWKSTAYNQFFHWKDGIAETQIGQITRLSD